MCRAQPHRTTRRRVLALALSSLLAVTGTCAQDIAAPAADQSVMARAADMVYARELERARVKRSLDVDKAQVAMARRVGSPMMAYAATFAPVAAPWSWALHVETRDEPVAYCLPGGKIMLSTGLVDRMKLTPGELAVVLAHVIAHALAGHDAATATARLAALPFAPDPNRRALQLADILGKIMLNDPHDKEIERETDAMALEFMARAGMDPEPAVETWRKIARAGGATPPGFLSLHPTWPGRIDEIEAQIAPLLPLFEQAKAEIAARPRQPPVRSRPGLN
jgi:Zn-dependent protease with chaperone function